MACERRLDQEDSWATNTTIAVAIRSRALARLIRTVREDRSQRNIS